MGTEPAGQAEKTREPGTVTELKTELVAADRRTQVLGIGLAVLLALGFGDLSATMATDAPRRWLFVVVLVLAFAAAALLGRAWVDSHAGQRRIDLALATEPELEKNKLDVISNRDVTQARSNYDNACSWITLAAYPLVGAALSYVAVAIWWAVAG